MNYLSAINPLID